MHSKKLNCLLIGGNGFIGSWLAKNLIDNNNNVTILDAEYNYFHLKSEEFNRVKEFRKKILQKKAFSIAGNFQNIGQELLKKNKYDVIVHLAAHAIEKPFDSTISTSQITDDILLTYSIISAIRNSSINTRLIFLSSSAVYGHYDYAATETMPVNPQSIYGISKATSEMLIKSNLDNWNIVRSNAVYGFGDLGDRATHILAEKAFNKEKAWVNTSVWCDFIYVKDLVEGIFQVIKNAPPEEIFNISGGKPYKLEMYANELTKYLPFDFTLRSVHDRPNRGVLTNTKAQMLLNWTPKFDLASGVKDYIQYVKKYNVA